MPLGIRDAITPEALAEIARFADIQNAFRRAAQEIHAGAGRQRPEKLLAETLCERFRRIEEPELTGGHAMISTQVRFRAQWLINPSRHGARPLGRFSVVKSVDLNLLDALEKVALKRLQGRAPSRIVPKTRNFRLEVVYY